MLPVNHIIYNPFVLMSYSIISYLIFAPKISTFPTLSLRLYNNRASAFTRKIEAHKKMSTYPHICPYISNWLHMKQLCPSGETNSSLTYSIAQSVSLILSSLPCSDIVSSSLSFLHH